MSQLKKEVLWYLCLAIIIATFAMIVGHYFGGFAAAVVVMIPLAMIANGWLATWEDEQAGGFNNPRPQPKAPENPHDDADKT